MQLAWHLIGDKHQLRNRYITAAVGDTVYSSNDTSFFDNEQHAFVDAERKRDSVSCRISKLIQFST